MATLSNAREVTRELRRVRQIRSFQPDAVPADAVRELLKIAQWTGSSRNTQPWRFVAITDKEVLRQLSQVRTPINWVVNAPLGIAIVLNGDAEVSEAYDEGRVTERLLIGAHLLDLGAGTAWFGDATQQQRAKEILGIPAEQTARSVVAIGYPVTSRDPRPNPSQGGRKPLSEIVSYDRMRG